MKIKLLPQQIKDRLKFHVDNQKRGYDESKNVIDSFNWSITPEGHDFWYNIEQGIYKYFYDKYPDEKQLKLDRKKKEAADKARERRKEAKQKEEENKLYAFLNS